MNEKKHQRITTRQLIEERLDAHYYGEEFLNNELFLKACGLPLSPIGSIAERCNCGATPKEVVYGQNGQGLIRTSDVRPNIFEADRVLRTTALSVRRESNVAAITDDLLYTMSGTIGYAAVVPSTNEIFSFSNTIARVRLPKGGSNDSRFTSAFFNCKYGYTQSVRLVSGGIQGHVMPNPFKKLLVPTPDSKAQAYIGGKVRQAERLRERARFLNNSVYRIIELLIERQISQTELIAAQKALTADNPSLDNALLSSLSEKKGSSTTKVINQISQNVDGFKGKILRNGAFISRIPSRMVRKRLDPGGYHPDLLSIRKVLESSQISVKELQEMGSFPANDRRKLSAEQVKAFVSILHINQNGFLDLQEAESHKPDGFGIPCQNEDVLISCINPKENRIAVYSSSEISACSMEFSVFRTEHANPHYIAAFLRSICGLRQMIHLGHGTSSSRRRVSEDELRSVVVLDLEIDGQDYIGEKSRVAGICYAESRKLPQAARLLVEALIEGKVSEEELKRAQEALERGDNSLDQAILARLTRKGIDEAKEQPLFADLDALYDAIAQTSTADEEKERQ